MKLSRKWLNEFVDCSAGADHDFSEAMTLSGSKVETFTDLHKNIQNVVAGRIVEMVRHTNSDHMWVCQVDVGGSDSGRIECALACGDRKLSRVSVVQMRRSRMPVRAAIHSSEVSRKLESSSLVTDRCGSAEPVPVMWKAMILHARGAIRSKRCHACLLT